MDILFANLKNGTAIPASQVIRTTPRGGTPGAAPAITSANVPAIAATPSAANAITFSNNTLAIPDRARREAAALLAGGRLLLFLDLLDHRVVLLDRRVAGGHVGVGRLLARLDVRLHAIAVALELAVEGSAPHVGAHHQAAGILGLRAAGMRGHLGGWWLLGEGGAGTGGERRGKGDASHGVLSVLVEI